MTTQKNLGEAVVHVRATVHGMKDLADLKNALQNFGNGLQGFSGNMTKAGDALQIAAEASRTTLRNMRHLSFALRDAGRQALGFGAAVAAGFAPIIIEGAKFEQAVADVRSVIGGLREDSVTTSMIVAELAEQFIYLGEISEFSATQVAQAAQALALAGFSANELKQALPTVVNLASASGTDLQRTAEIVANISRSFGLEADNFARVGDILTQTFTNSNTTLESLAETMKILAPTASALGVTLEEAAAAAGILGDRGIRGTLAGTGLSRAFNQIREEADKFGEALEKVGSSYSRIDLTKNSLSDIVAEFERIQKISNEDFLNIAEIFDERAARSFINLIQGGSEAFDRILKLNQQASGVADAVRQIRLDTLAGDAEKLKSNFQSLLVEVFEVLKPRIREMVQGLISIVDSIRAWVKENPALVASLARMAEILISIVVPAGAVLLVMGKIVAFAAGFYSLGVAISSAQAQFAILQQTMAAATAQSIALQAAMTRVRIAALLFKTAMIGTIAGTAAAVGILIGLQLGNWIMESARAAYEASDAYRELNAEILALIRNTELLIKRQNQQTDNSRQAIELMQKGTNLTAKDFEELKRLTGSESGLAGGTSAVDEIRAQFRANQEKIFELNDKAAKLGEQIDASAMPAWKRIGYNLSFGLLAGDFGFKDLAEKKAEYNDLNKEIEKLQEANNKLVESMKDASKTSQSFKTVRDALLGGNANLAEKVKKDQEALISVNDQIMKANEDFISAPAEERQNIQDRISLLLKERELLEARLKLLSPMQGAVGDRDFLAEAGGNIEAATAAFKDFLNQQEAARTELEKLKAVEESYGMTLEDIEKGLKRNAETLREKIDAIREATDAQDEYLKSAMAVAIAENDMTKATAIGALRARIAQKATEDQNKLIDEANEKQAETIDGLQLERAERERNVAEYEKMKKKVGQAAIQSEANDLFQLTGDPAQDAQILARQKEFIRLKEEELQLEIEAQKKTWSDEDKKAAEKERKELEKKWKTQKEQAKERDDIEMDILKSLAGQAQNARELAYFMSMIAAIEQKREDAVYNSQRRTFRAAEMLEALDRRRRKLAAAGEDTASIDNLIRRKKQEFLLMDAFFQRRQKTAGIDVGGTGFDPNTIPDKIKNTMTPEIETALNNIQTLFAASPAMWVDAFLLEWIKQIARLKGFVSNGFNLDGNLPGIPNPFTLPNSANPNGTPLADNRTVQINVNNNGADLDLLRRTIRDALNSGGFSV
jgi:TP901 family phage tail tape measure protein